MAPSPECPDPAPAAAEVLGEEQRGVALIFVVIFTLLLGVLVSELVTTARMSRLTGENDALLARMHNHMERVLLDTEQTLLDDLSAGAAQSAAGGAGAPGAGAPGGLPMPGGTGGPGQGGEEGSVDSSQDAWYEPTGNADGDLTTYVWVEDENRKFNVLALASPKEEFARDSKDRFVRLIDALRENTEFDLSTSDGERLATALIDWMRGAGRSEALPKPPLKSDDEKRRQETVPFQLEELLLLPGVTEDLYYDKVLDGRLIPGLESVLTVYTALRFDPGDPTKANQPGQQGSNNPGSSQPGNSGTGQNTQNRSGGTQQGGQSGGTSGGQGTTGEPEQPVGEGIRININTAPRAVLRALFPVSEIPDATIEAILRFRNEEMPEETGETGEPGAGQPAAFANAGGSGELDAGVKKKRKIFQTVQDLDQIPEFQNLANPGVKERFYRLTTTKSHVFTVHMASMFKKNEERRVFVLRRSRSIVVRLEDGEEGSIHPITRLEEVKGLRIFPVDFPEDESLLRAQLDEMDQYSREERAWNPYFLDFYIRSAEVEAQQRAEGR
ncbi:MAG: general secretion pathway protein GspK [Planctomycetes bacterium]|nr:general secretion pathway protein GspK [Planctomycetota bacterium]